MKLLFILLLFPYLGICQQSVSTTALTWAEVNDDELIVEAFDSTIHDKKVGWYQIGNKCHATYQDKYDKWYFIVHDRLNGDRIKFYIPRLNKDRIRPIK